MTPTRITGANVHFTPPENWQDTADETCGDLHVRVDGDHFRSAWRPSASDLETLNDGGAVVVSVRGGQPPVSVGVEAADPEERYRGCHHPGDALTEHFRERPDTRCRLRGPQRPRFTHHK